MCRVPPATAIYGGLPARAADFHDVPTASRLAVRRVPPRTASRAAAHSPGIFPVISLSPVRQALGRPQKTRRCARGWEATATTRVLVERGYNRRPSRTVRAQGIGWRLPLVSYPGRCRTAVDHRADRAAPAPVSDRSSGPRGHPRTWPSSNHNQIFTAGALSRPNDLPGEGYRSPAAVRERPLPRTWRSAGGSPATTEFRLPSVSGCARR